MDAARRKRRGKGKRREKEREYVEQESAAKLVRRKSRDLFCPAGLSFLAPACPEIIGKRKARTAPTIPDGQCELFELAAWKERWRSGDCEC